MKRLCLFALVASVCGGAIAQDLDTVTIVDQLNEGQFRGNNVGNYSVPDDPATTDIDESQTTVWGASMRDGSDFVDYSGPDVTTTVDGVAVTTSIRYINTWAGFTEGPSGPLYESPIQTVTSAMDNHDRAQTGSIPAVSANPNPTATGGDTGMLVGDDGGYNSIFFGESNDSDYYVQVDMYCPVNNVGTGTEESALVARAARDDGPTQEDRRDYSYTGHLDGSYAIYYVYGSAEATAVVYPGVLGEPINVVGTKTGITDGWHTLRIECVGNRITYLFDDEVMASIIDDSFSEGRPGMYYWTAGTSSSSGERQALFDNLRAGPQEPPSSVTDWTLF